VKEAQCKSNFNIKLEFSQQLTESQGDNDHMQHLSCTPWVISLGERELSHGVRLPACNECSKHHHEGEQGRQVKPKKVLKEK
jgi:hypothetical protein